MGLHERNLKDEVTIRAEWKIGRSAKAAGVMTHLRQRRTSLHRRLMSVISSGRGDLKSLVTHRYKLADVVSAYDLFSHQRGGVLKVAITP
jgi:threonine dehydrogenase-like Zn-dependent dehydrogenase